LTPPSPQLDKTLFFDLQSVHVAKSGELVNAYFPFKMIVSVHLQIVRVQGGFLEGSSRRPGGGGGGGPQEKKSDNPIPSGRYHCPTLGP
jgi:hypothetical protein